LVYWQYFRTKQLHIAYIPATFHKFIYDDTHEKMPPKSCCELPQVIAQGYLPAGTYVTINNIRHYVTGPKDATKAIFLIYDIFGYTPQILQGADILSTAARDDKYLVFMPDFFRGFPFDPSNYKKTDNPEAEAWSAGWWAQVGSFISNAKAVPGMIAAIEDEINPLAPDVKLYPNIAVWGFVGFCWGGKVGSFLTSPCDKATGHCDAFFAAAAHAHPAQLDAVQAAKINVPTLVLASIGEQTIVPAFMAALQAPKKRVDFDLVHGFMSGRADLAVAEELTGYNAGYLEILKWFKTHITVVTNSLI